METRSHAQVKAAPPPSFTPVRVDVLQRKCACGGAAGLAGECEECDKKRLSLQRSTENSELETRNSKLEARNSASVAPIVPEVLSSPGQPLDKVTRAIMEPRFGHDFSHVRVHTDLKAAESASAIHALAYTLGTDIVFGSRQYQPAALSGQKLLAHELTHTIQQLATSPASPAAVRLGRPDDMMEHEAESLAEGILGNTGRPVTNHYLQNSPTIQRQGVGIELVPTDPEEAEKLRKLGVNLPEVSAETWTAIGGGGNHAHQPLEDGERTAIAKLTKTEAPSSPLAIPEGARFVLHDTVGNVTPEKIEEHKGLGRGPLAETGASAFVPAAGDPTVTRDEGLFDPRRPSTTEFEKGEDVMKKADRQQEYRAVWGATSVSEQSAALDNALSNQRLSEDEKTKEQAKALSSLKPSAATVSTTAAWAVAEICRKIAGMKDDQVAAVASSAKVASVLTGSCQKLKPLFEARESRIKSSVNVEIVQVPGTERTDKPTRLPDYTQDQYKNVMLLYFKSALQVDQFPEITSHYLIDKTKNKEGKAIGDHYDPRCFNLSKLYRMIRTSLGHGVGSTYGITPNYEPGPDQNIWWNEIVCGGKPPV